MFLDAPEFVEFSILFLVTVFYSRGSMPESSNFRNVYNFYYNLIATRQLQRSLQ